MGNGRKRQVFGFSSLRILQIKGQGTQGAGKARGLVDGKRESGRDIIADVGNVRFSSIICSVSTTMIHAHAEQGLFASLRSPCPYQKAENL